MKGLEYLAQLATWKGSGKFSLGHVFSVLAELDNPQDKVPAIHVGGTNGKGSVCSAVAAMAGSSGAKVGLTISPHLSSPTERIVIDGNPIGVDELDEMLIGVKAAADRTKIQLSHFEAITCAFFLVVAERRLDLQVVEVGLGGALDATNVLRRPLVSGIVSVDFDHEDILGASLAQIAGEKAGIVKPGVPVVVGALMKEALEPIRRVAETKGSELIVYGEQFTATTKESNSEIVVSLRGGEQISAKLALAGSHQSNNMAVAAALAAEAGFSSSAIKTGIENVFWPARLERVVYRDKSFLLDASHNPAGIRSLISYLETRAQERRSLIFGVLRTKRWKEMLKLLAGVFSEIAVVTPDSPMAADPEEVVKVLSGFGVKTERFDSDYEAALEWGTARQTAEVVVAGSIYMVGRIREMMGVPLPALWQRDII